jgi:hypothetical protein
MTRPTIYDGNDHREMTEAEYAQHQLDQAEAVERTAEKAAKIAARSAVLAKLGLSAEEAAALLG